MVADLQFDAGTHEYRVKGVLFPSVTQVLGVLEDWGGIPAPVLAAASAFGRHVHEACHLHNRGELDWAALDPALFPYVNQYRRFLDETGAVVVASEMRVVHPILRYAGTLDVVVDWRAKLCPIDIKTTAVVPPTVGPQTAAYAQAYGRNTMKNRYCLHLRADDYRAIALKETTDWNVFQAALTLHHWKARNQ